MDRKTALATILAAAVFYALNVPFSKLLLEQVPPTCLAALLYLGAGAGVGIMYAFRFRREPRSGRLTKQDAPYAVGMILPDIAAPILLMLGIRLGTAANAALLGNFEIVATTIIALLFFREAVSSWLWAAVACITAASAILSLESGGLQFSAGSLLVLGATVCWGLENNCTRRISVKSTYQIVTLKGVFSGLGSLAIAVVIGESLPPASLIWQALALGFVAYGLSIFTYIRAQSVLGAAKTSAYYAVAPFAGAGLALLLLHEPLSADFLLALGILAVGTVLVVFDSFTQRHTHLHAHSTRTHHAGRKERLRVVHSHPHRHLFCRSRHEHHGSASR